MSTAAHTQLMQHLFAELARGNVQPLIDHIADDVVWTFIGKTRFSGTFRGKQDLLSRWFAPFAAELASLLYVTADRFIAQGDVVVIQGRSHARAKNGKTYENTICTIYRLENGLIREVTEHLDTAMLTATFGR